VSFGQGSIGADGRAFRQTALGCKNGFSIGRSLFDHVEPNMSIYRDEIFGPVLSMARTYSYREAADHIDGHNSANGTAIFTRDGDTARTFS